MGAILGLSGLVSNCSAPSLHRLPPLPRASALPSYRPVTAPPPTPPLQYLQRAHHGRVVRPALRVRYRPTRESSSEDCSLLRSPPLVLVTTSPPESSTECAFESQPLPSPPPQLGPHLHHPRSYHLLPVLRLPEAGVTAPAPQHRAHPSQRNCEAGAYTRPLLGLT